MSNPTRVGHALQSLLPDVEGVDRLAELALDMRWSWSHATDQVWRELEPALWELTHNPWAVLQAVSRDRLQRLADDAGFRQRVDALIASKRQAGRAGLVCAEASALRTDPGRLLQHGIHAQRGFADLLRRA